jgi:hypothetical protein
MNTQYEFKLINMNSHKFKWIQMNLLQMILFEYT